MDMVQEEYVASFATKPIEDTSMNRIKSAKSDLWQSNDEKVSVRIVEIENGCDAMEFWTAKNPCSTVIEIEDVEAILHALAYFKNTGVIGGITA